jgi:hypothetical protein
MKLVCYAFGPNPLPLRPAPVARDWMDRVPDRHAYRCLPLNIANAHGWEVASPCAFEVEWDGGPRDRSMAIRALDGSAADTAGHVNTLRLAEPVDRRGPGTPG